MLTGLREQQSRIRQQCPAEFLRHSPFAGMGDGSELRVVSVNKVLQPRNPVPADVVLYRRPGRFIFKFLPIEMRFSVELHGHPLQSCQNGIKNRGICEKTTQICVEKLNGFSMSKWNAHV